MLKLLRSILLQLIPLASRHLRLLSYQFLMFLSGTKLAVHSRTEATGAVWTLECIRFSTTKAAINY
jgi:hypothetical protein